MWFARDNLAEDRGDRSLEGTLAGNHLVQDHSQCVDVGRRTNLAVPRLDLLRSHIRRTAEDRAALCQLRFTLAMTPSQSEVHDDRLVVAGQHDVGGLQVTMHDAELVGLL